MCTRIYRLIIYVALLATGLLASGGPSMGQGSSRAREWPIAVRSREMPTPATSLSTSRPAQQTPAAKVFLPHVSRYPEATPVQFATELDAQGAPANPALSFARGVTTIYASTIISGNSGDRYLLTWTLDGRIAPSLSASGTLSAATQRVSAGFCNSSGSGCSLGLLPIDRRTLLVQVYVNGLLVSQGSAMIV